MNGIVTAINSQRGMVGIQYGRFYTIVELLDDWEVDLKDEMQWSDNEPLGHGQIYNQTKGVHFEVYFQNHSVHESNLRQQLLIV